jgi:two-component system response regulator FixJ
MELRLVYVIDDDADMLHSTAFLLRSMDCQVETFADGAAFLAAFPSLEPGCVVTDLRMPGVNGYELKAALDECSAGWPIVLMTSESGADTAAEAATHGFAAYLRKPFPADLLAAALDKGFAALSKRRS